MKSSILTAREITEEFESIGWEVEEISGGHGAFAVLCVEKVYPFEEDVRYLVVCPNSDKCNDANEESNKFEVLIESKEYEVGASDGEALVLDTLEEVIDLIYGEE
jgi:hypothetical protein